MIYLNYYNVSNIKNYEYTQLKELVSKERRERAERCYRMEDAIRCIFAELLLRYSFHNHYTRMLNMDIYYNKHGKPYICSNEKFYYNLSHSGDWVVIVYGDVEVGVDVEKTNENYNLIYDSCFTNVEMQWIDKADKASKAQRMAMVWTMKEAYLKYIGTGLFKSMHSFSMDMENGAILDDTGEIVRNVYTHCFSISKNYVCSVCSSEVQVCESEVSEMEMQSFLKKGNMVFGTP